MRIARTHLALDALPAEMAAEVAELRAQVMGGFDKIVWPPGAAGFTIPPIPKGNGVTPIKTAMMAHLEEQGWGLEQHFEALKAAGPVDATRHHGSVRSCLEWETGNVASSYRVLLKMMKALSFGVMDAGFLVVSDKSLGRYLTDRIGTDDEISWTFEMMPRLFPHGYIEILVMEADAFDTRVEAIPKQACGNGKAAQQKGRSPAMRAAAQPTLFMAADIPENGALA